MSETPLENKQLEGVENNSPTNTQGQPGGHLKNKISSIQKSLEGISKDLKIESKHITEFTNILKNLNTAISDKEKITNPSHVVYKKNLTLQQENLTKLKNSLTSSNGQEHPLTPYINKLNTIIHEEVTTLDKSNEAIKKIIDPLTEKKETEGPLPEGDQAKHLNAYRLYDGFIKAKKENPTTASSPDHYLKTLKNNAPSKEVQELFSDLVARQGTWMDSTIRHQLTLQGAEQRLDATSVLKGKLMTLAQKPSGHLLTYLDTGDDIRLLTTIRSNPKLLEQAQILITPRSDSGFESYYTLTLRIPDKNGYQTLQLYMDSDGEFRSHNELVEYQKTISGALTALVDAYDKTNGSERFAFAKDDLNPKASPAELATEKARLATTKEHISKLLGHPEYFRMLLEGKLKEAQKTHSEKTPHPLTSNINALKKLLAEGKVPTITNMQLRTKDRQKNIYTMTFSVEGDGVPKHTYTIDINSDDLRKLPLSTMERHPLYHDALMEKTDYTSIHNYLKPTLTGINIDTRPSVFSPYAYRLRSEGGQQIKSLIVHLDPTKPNNTFQQVATLLNGKLYTKDKAGKQTVNKDEWQKFITALPPTLGKGVHGIRISGHPGTTYGKKADGSWNEVATNVVQIDLLDHMPEPFNDAGKKILDKAQEEPDLSTDLGILRAMSNSNGTLMLLGRLYETFGKKKGVEIKSGNASMSPERAFDMAMERNAQRLLSGDIKHLFEVSQRATPEQAKSTFTTLKNLLQKENTPLKDITATKDSWEKSLQSLFHQYAHQGVKAEKLPVGDMTTILTSLKKIQKEATALPPKDPNITSSPEYKQLVYMITRGQDFLDAYKDAQKMMEIKQQMETMDKNKNTSWKFTIDGKELSVVRNTLSNATTPFVFHPKEHTPTSGAQHEQLLTEILSMPDVAFQKDAKDKKRTPSQSKAELLQWVVNQHRTSLAKRGETGDIQKHITHLQNISRIRMAKGDAVPQLSKKEVVQHMVSTLISQSSAYLPGTPEYEALVLRDKIKVPTKLPKTPSGKVPTFTEAFTAAQELTLLQFGYSITDKSGARQPLLTPRYNNAGPMVTWTLSEGDMTHLPSKIPLLHAYARYIPRASGYPPVHPDQDFGLKQPLTSGLVKNILEQHIDSWLSKNPAQLPQIKEQLRPLLNKNDDESRHTWAVLNSLIQKHTPKPTPATSSATKTETKK